MDSLEINYKAPDFNLVDLTGDRHSLSDYGGQIVIINFWSAECPWAKRADELLKDMLRAWGEEIVWLSIASNANEPADMLKTVAEERNIPTVLVDSDQAVADIYHAQTTPHVFLIDPSGLLRYQGAVDDASFRQSNPSQDYLKNAVAALMRAKSPTPAETLPYGCALVRFPS